MPLQNVSDDIVCSPVVRNDMVPILTLASDFPNVQNIVAREDDPIFPVLQKEMELLKDSLQNASSTKVPFTPYLSKSQKKKAAKATYATRSQGPLPNSK